MKEELRKELVFSVAKLLTQEQLTSFERDLDIILNDYDIQKKSTDIVPFDYSNYIIIKNYISIKKLEGYSLATLKAYKRYLEVLLADVGKNIRDITTNDIRYHFAHYSQTHNISNISLDNMRRAYHSFFKWCMLEKIITENPCDRIKPFKSRKKEITPFTSKELEKMCDACTNTRDRALIEFLYATGVRANECVNLDKTDVDMETMKVFVKQGKCNKDRITYISEKCMFWLEKYLKERNDDNPWLWNGRQGRLSKRAVEIIVGELGEKTGIEAYPHKFRHTLATDMIARGAPVQMVQKLLGHEDISTTMIYVNVKNSDVESMYRKLIV